MWVVVWGQRAYGVVEAHGGEHARTVFQHLYFVPLFPIESQWVDSNGDCLPIARHPWSIAAAYLRTWGAVVALGPFAFAPSVVTGVLAGVLLALKAWSWMWHPLGRSLHHRSDFNLLAFGSRCDPARMTREQREELLAALKKRAGSEMRPPEDVARFGATSLQEAVTAYGILRIGEVERGQFSGHVQQLISGKYETSAGEGPIAREAGPANPRSSSRWRAPRAR